MKRQATRSIWLTLAFLATSTAGASPQWPTESTLDPQSYVSPSGAFTLSVEPNNSRGAGEAKYRLTQGLREVWEGSRPYTLWNAEVADDGMVAGYGYGAGRDGGKGDSFVVVIMDPSGDERLVERNERSGIRGNHGLPRPSSAGLFLDPWNDRLVVRVWDADMVSMESWWTYEASTGRPMTRFRPKESLGEVKNVFGIDGVRPVPSTPLVLVHWDREDFRKGRRGALFTLFDLSGALVWSLELFDDYTIPDDEGAEEALQREMDGGGALLPGDGPRRFALRHVAENLRVTYEATELPGERQGWLVREVARVPYESAVDREVPRTDSGATEGSLRHLGTIELGSAVAAPKTPIHDIVGFSIDGSGRLGFVRHEPLTGIHRDFVLIETDGSLVTELPLPGTKGKETRYHAAWVAGERWVVTASPQQFGSVSSAWWLDLPDRWTSIENFQGPVVESLIGTEDGGFLVYGHFMSKYTMSAAVLAFDAQGESSWSRTGQIGSFVPRMRDGREIPVSPRIQYAPDGSTWSSTGQTLLQLGPGGVVERVLGVNADGSTLGEISELTLGPDGRIYAVDFRSCAVHVFLPNGTASHVCKPIPGELAAVSSSRLAVDERGEVYLWTLFGGPRGVLHFAADGERLGLEPIEGMWHFQPATGSCWMTTRRTLVLLDDNGLVLRETQRAPDGAWLRYLERASVASDGSIAVIDKRAHPSWVVHLYATNGDPIRTIDPPSGASVEDVFAYDGARLAFVEKEVGKSPGILLVDLRGKPLLRFTPEREATRWQPFFSGRGRELWLFDGEKRIERYALP